MDESINSEDNELKEMGEVIDDDKQKMSKKEEVFHIKKMIVIREIIESIFQRSHFTIQI